MATAEIYIDRGCLDLVTSVNSQHHIMSRDTPVVGEVKVQRRIGHSVDNETCQSST